MKMLIRLDGEFMTMKIKAAIQRGFKIIIFVRPALASFEDSVLPTRSKGS